MRNKRMDKIKRKNAQKIIVAMSGGVDSSVAAALLKRAGVDELRSSPRFANARVFDVIGVFMKFWMAPEKDGLIGAWNRCCSPEAEARARKVAKILKIPFYVFNFEKEFKKRIVDYFLREYKAGRTPNPCVVCNRDIKFGFLLEKALALNADFVATGHYARIRNTKYKIRDTKYKLLRARDKEKDQSYFLWQLSQKQLEHILFPVGNYTKKEVRNLAKKFRLPVFDIPESMELCFIPTTINDFLSRYLQQKPGKIIDTNGKTIGEHQGLAFYTIGQRKGIGLSGGPFYVLDKNLENNFLIVTKNEKDLFKKELIAKDVNWISGKEPRLLLKIRAKIRYKHEPTLAMITKNPEGKPSASYGAGLEPRTYTLKFNRPQRTITPGQSVVFYKNNEVLGGAIIG